MLQEQKKGVEHIMNHPNLIRLLKKEEKRRRNMTNGDLRMLKNTDYKA